MPGSEGCLPAHFYPFIQGQSSISHTEIWWEEALAILHYVMSFTLDSRPDYRSPSSNLWAFWEMLEGHFPPHWESDSLCGLGLTTGTL